MIKKITGINLFSAIRKAQERKIPKFEYEGKIYTRIGQARKYINFSELKKQW